MSPFKNESLMMMWLYALMCFDEVKLMTHFENELSIQNNEVKRMTHFENE
ncbi:hypothetical protein Scep_013958 [Stephania cephalantha]|uniref:Uncharacterized protein n=1 Tax=Stephania cephalantha TaxID=152367 RepID=A0AAP0J031_9MAGN